jgi:hypothetical protein
MLYVSAGQKRYRTMLLSHIVLVPVRPQMSSAVDPLRVLL